MIPLLVKFFFSVFFLFNIFLFFAIFDRDILDILMDKHNVSGYLRFLSLRDSLCLGR